MAHSRIKEKEEVEEILKVKPKELKIKYLITCLVSIFVKYVAYVVRELKIVRRGKRTKGMI